jgi:hypothetical protein
MLGNKNPREQLEALETLFRELQAKNNTITLQLGQIETLLKSLGAQNLTSSSAMNQPQNTLLVALNPGAKFRLKPVPPNDFSRDQSKGRVFLNSCELYFSLVLDHFLNDKAVINWVLTFMKSG